MVLATGDVFKLSFAGGRSCCCVYYRLERAQVDLVCCYSSPGDWRLGHGLVFFAAAVINEHHAVKAVFQHSATQRNAFHATIK